jgi:tetratricopeptide (TPR) repeat protein
MFTDVAPPCAREELERSLALARDTRNAAALGDIHQTLGWVDVRYGNIREARAHFEASLDHHRMANNIGDELTVMLGLSETDRQLGNFDEARRFVDEAIALSRRHGYRWLLSTELNQRGEIAMAEGDYSSAQRFYGEAFEVSTMIGGSDVPIHRLNLALATLYAGDAQRARRMTVESLEEFERRGWIVYSYYSGLGVLWCDAALGDHAEWDARYDDLLERATPAMASRESADHAITAGEHWARLGDPLRATQAFRLARRLIPEGLRDEMEPRVAERMNELETAQKRVPRD